MEELAYSFSLTTFSPSGHLRQIQHALSAVENGRLTVGIRCANGVAILTHKALDDQLIDPSTVQLVCKVSEGCGAGYSGLSADYRNLLGYCRKAAQEYAEEFGEQAPVNVVAQSVAGIMQGYTQKGGVRPFGCSVLLAGRNLHGDAQRPDGTPVYSLYQVDPSGAFYEWSASATGHMGESARGFLERRYGDDLDIEDGIVLGLSCLAETADGDITADTVEVGVIGGSFSADKFVLLGRDAISRYIRAAE